MQCTSAEVGGGADGRGPWWSRWMVGYLAGTAWVLRGLAAIGADVREPWVLDAVRWVKGKQNADGGWGELPGCYADPARAGEGPSMAPLTGLVLTGLMAAGEARSGEVERGVEYLLGAQRADGSFPLDGFLHVYMPPRQFYAIEASAQHYAVEALGVYVEVTSDRGRFG